MLKIMHKFQKVIAVVLAVIMAVIIVFATVDLGWTVIEDILKHPHYLLDVRNVLKLLGLLITITIAIELLETVRVYFDESSAIRKIEVVMLVAMTAIAREVIILDLHELAGITLVGVAAIIAALSFGYFLIKRSMRATGEPTPPEAKKEG